MMSGAIDCASAENRLGISGGSLLASLLPTPVRTTHLLCESRVRVGLPNARHCTRTRSCHGITARLVRVVRRRSCDDAGSVLTHAGKLCDAVVVVAVCLVRDATGEARELGELAARELRTACSSRAVQCLDALIAREDVVGRLVEAGEVACIQALEQIDAAMTGLKKRPLILANRLVHLALKCGRRIGAAGDVFACAPLLACAVGCACRADEGGSPNFSHCSAPNGNGTPTRSDRPHPCVRIRAAASAH